MPSRPADRRAIPGGARCYAGLAAPRPTRRTDRAAVATSRFGGRRMGVTGAVVSLFGSIAIRWSSASRCSCCSARSGRSRRWPRRAPGGPQARVRRRARRRDAEACIDSPRAGRECCRARHRPSPRHRAIVLLGAPETSGLWTWRPAHGDAFRVSTGWGSARCEIPLGVDIDSLRPDLRPVVDAASLLRDVPGQIDLAADAGDAIATVGGDHPPSPDRSSRSSRCNAVRPTGASW